MVFALAENEDSKESRFYFAAAGLIELTEDDNKINLRSRHAQERGMLIKKEAVRLADIFRAALADNF